MLTAYDVCEQFQFSRATLERMVRRGDFPAPVRIGPRMIRWRPADIARFLDGDADDDLSLAEGAHHG